MILEGANNPTTPEPTQILTDNGMLVIPDVLANAGGVIVSYFEWVQNLQHFSWDEREVNDRLARPDAAGLPRGRRPRPRQAACPCGSRRTSSALSGWSRPAASAGTPDTSPRPDPCGWA